MCKFCGHYPCHPSCPNAPVEKPEHECSECGKPIWSGDWYYDDGEKEVCEECVREMSLSELMELFEVKFKTA